MNGNREALATLPHSPEAERAVLGALLLDQELFPQIAARLLPSDFYAEKHELLFAAMMRIHAEERPIDLRTLQAELEAAGKLDLSGGIVYMAQLDLDLPDIGRVDAYVDIVKERSARRQLFTACQVTMREALNGPDLATAAAVLEAEIKAVSAGLTREVETTFGATLDATLQAIEDSETGLSGIQTGFAGYDEITSGLCPDHLVILAARPGMGKTSFALNICQHVAIDQGLPVAIFSLEMSKEELSLKIVASEAGVSTSILKRNGISTGQWSTVIKTQRRISSAPIYIDERSTSMPQICAKARRWHQDYGIKIIVIDYLQLMPTKSAFREQEISAMSRTLKLLAKELHVPVVLLSQLNRECDKRNDKRPQLSDLRESGAIEQNADLVAFIFREEYYSPQSMELRGKAELIVAKHRHGEVGTVQLTFDGPTTTFRSGGQKEEMAPWE